MVVKQVKANGLQRDLSRGAKQVLATFMALYGSNGGAAKVDEAALAKACGLSESILGKYIDELSMARLIGRRHRIVDGPNAGKRLFFKASGMDLRSALEAADEDR